MTSLINRNQVVEKPSDKKRTRKTDFESAFDRLDKKGKESRKSFTSQDPNALEQISNELYFRSMVPRLVNRCQGNCGDKLFPDDKENYLVEKSRGRISFMNEQGQMDSKLCPLYIYFKLNALKNMHGVYMMYTTKPSLSQKLRLEKIHLPDYKRK